MKTTTKILTIAAITCQFAICNLQLTAQNNSIVLDGAYLVIDGGTAANNIYVVVDQPSPSGIVRLPAGGHIHSENQYNFVKWLSGTSTGSYVFPFGIGGNAADYIPFTFNKTIGNSSVSMSTWTTNTQNLPKPAATNVGAVTSMTGITDSVLFSIDRFWDIQTSAATTADLTFSYRGIENTTSNPTTNIQAQHWNGSAWDAPVGPGTAGVTTGIGSAGPFIGQTTFSPWVLITTTTCTTDTFTQNPTICQGQSITVGANSYTTTGTFIDTLTNVLGCDSIITTNLTVNPTATSTANATICQGQSILLGGALQTTAGNYNDTIFGGSSLGCDSVITTTLTVTPTATSTANATICQGQSILLGGALQTTAGNYNDTIFGGSSLGCDSVITTTLTVTPNSTFTQNPVICQGQNFTLPGGMVVNTAGTFIDTLQNAAVSGCDSLVTTNLTVSPAAIFNQNFVECQGFSIIVGSNIYNTTGIFIDTLTAISGCDSIVTTNLTINTPTKTTNVFNECQGFSVTVGANTYTTTGIFIDIINNCDTMVTNLTINPAPQLTLIKADDNCGENIGSVTANVISANPPVTYNWNTGSTDSIISNLPAGTYMVTVNDGSGCAKADTVNLAELQIDCDFFVYTPNAFTPNGDGNNDVFFVRGKGIETLSVKIYNRWGNKVFEINDVAQGWDGKYKGAEQNTAVFVYVLEATFLNGKTITENGDISLIR